MRMHLKNKNKYLFWKRIVIVFIIIAFFCYFGSLLFKNAGYFYLNYSEKEAKKIIDVATSYGVSDDVLSSIKNKDLYKITRNSSGEIEMVDYDSYLVNLFLRDVSSNIKDALEREENAGVAFYVPFGSIFKSPVLNDFGPDIPVRMELIGSVSSNVVTNVKEYGINNSLIEMYVHVVVKERVILPVLSKTIVVTNDVPISYKIIKGTVPSYYGDVLKKESSIYSIPNL